MATPTEQLIAPTFEHAEVYGKSLRNLRVMGSLALAGYTETQEYHGAFAERWHDFETCIVENLAGDEEFGEKLGFGGLKPFQIQDGQVVDRADQPMVDLVRIGWRESRKAAQANPEMWVQAERDEGDVMVAHIVDNLEEGEMYVVISREPEAELERNPDFWRDEMNYREGMSVLQVYYRKSKNEMLAGGFAVKEANGEVIRQIFAGHGVHIPSGESSNRWVRYGIRQKVSEHRAKKFGPEFVRRHRQEASQSTAVLSVTELAKQNEDTLLRYFNTYMLPLSLALAGGNNNLAMSSFANSLLKMCDKLGASERRQLTRIANSTKFGDEDARFMEEKIRYATVEELRKLVPSFLKGERSLTAAETVNFVPISNSSWSERHLPQPDIFMLQLMNEQAARNVTNGLATGRSYPGCPGAGAGKPNNGSIPDGVEGNNLGSQDVFGGNVEKAGEDEYGSLDFKCPQGHKNTRPKGKLLDKCQVCRCDVRCK